MMFALWCITGTVCIKYFSFLISFLAGIASLCKKTIVADCPRV